MEHFGSLPVYAIEFISKGVGQRENLLGGGLIMKKIFNVKAIKNERKAANATSKIAFAILLAVSLVFLVSCSSALAGISVLPAGNVKTNTTESITANPVIDTSAGASNTKMTASDIKTTTPITVASTDLFSFKQKHEYLTLKLVKGTYGEEEQPDSLSMSVWRGNFILQLADESGKVLSVLDLDKVYEQTLIDVEGNTSKAVEELEFKGSFDIEAGDYNNDGDIDFTLGQHASSNGNVYKLFTIRKSNAIEQLKVKDYPELYITGGEPYSMQLEKLETSGFRIRQYYPGGPAQYMYFKWVNNEFMLDKTLREADGNQSLTLSSLDISLPANWKLESENQIAHNFINEKGENAGYLFINKYDSTYDLMTQKPNHSSVTSDESFDVPLGKCRLLSLDADNGTAASGITGTHNEYLASVSIKDKAILVLSFNKNDKKPETKEQFIKLLKSIKLK